MAAQDHAIAVGISRYPGLGAGHTALDLRGPDSDVDAVLGWLKDPAGGDVPAENIQVIRCPQTGVGPAGEPDQGTVERALVALGDAAEANRAAGLGYSVGRRLYIYMSGHGFSASPEKACLYTAEARTDWGRNVHATGWLSWLRDAGLFQELVLWMDCCMDGVGWAPGDPDLRSSSGTGPAGPSFVAFAAPRPLRAVERDLGDGVWHGVFTSILLEGLRGAAIDSNGRVTGRSLGDWLRNALAGRLSEADIGDPRVAKEPMIVRDDAELVFGRGIQSGTYPVNLVFPTEAVGRQARLWFGVPPATIRTFAVEAAGTIMPLTPGVYAAELPSLGLRQGFSVTGPATVAICERQDPVVPASPAQMFSLRVETPLNSGQAIRVVDCRFAAADAATGVLDVKLPYGLYKVRVSTGRSLREQSILLDGDLPSLDHKVLTQPSSTVTPIPGTVAASDPQATAIEATRAAACVAAQPGQGVLSLLARTFGGMGNDPAAKVPWRGGIRIVNGYGATVLQVGGSHPSRVDGDLYATASASVAPGAYFLRYEVQDQPIEQCLVAVGGWSLDTTLLFRPPIAPAKLDDMPRASLLMRRLDWLAEPARDARCEAARLALVDERDLLDGPLASALLDEFDDPMTGLLGAHLLLLASARGSQDLRRLPAIITRLADMVGPCHPDVVALMLASPTPPPVQPAPLSSPPMLARSWRLLVAATPSNKGLIPVELWRRVQAEGSFPPYLAWTTSDGTRASVRHDLIQALRRVFISTMAEPVSADLDNTAAGIPAAVDGTVDALARYGASWAGSLLGSVRPAVQLLAQDPRVVTALPAVASVWESVAKRAEQMGIPASAMADLITDWATTGTADQHGETN